MISNELIQGALIAKADSTPTITTYFPSGTVSEYEWQGVSGRYPMARLDIETQSELTDEPSCPSQVDFSWYIFSEKSSSKEANQLAGVFVATFRGLSCGLNHIKFTRIRILENIPAIRQDSRTWRAQVRCQSIVHNE